MSEARGGSAYEDEFSLRRLGAQGAGSALGRAAETPAGAPAVGLPKQVPRDDELFRERVDLRHVWSMIWEARGIFGLTIVCVIGFSAFFSYKQADQFKATATILQTEAETRLVPGQGYFYRSRNLKDLSRLVSLDPEVTRRAGELFPKHLNEALKELSAKGETLPADSQELVDYFLADPVLAGERIVGSSEVDADSKSNYMTLAVSGTHKHLVAPMTYALADAFVAYYLATKQEGKRKEASFIEKQIKERTDALAAKEQEIIKLRAEAMTGEAGELPQIISAEAELQLQILMRHELAVQEARIDLDATRIKVASVKERLEQVEPTVVVEESVRNPWETELVELYLQREEALTRFTNESPMVQTIDAKIARIRDLIENQASETKGVQVRGVNPVRSELERMLAVEYANLSSLEARIQALGKQIEGQNRKLLELPERTLPLERARSEKEVIRKVLLSLNEKLQDARVLKDYEIEELKLVGPPRAPGSPFAPNRGRAMAFAVFVAIFLAVVLAYLVSYMDNTIKTPSDIMRELEITPLGVIPFWPRNEVHMDPHEPLAGIAEVHGVLRNNIRHASASNPEKCLLIASALQGEGKSTLAANLAISYAQEGNRTLLIDVDFRKLEPHVLTKVVTVERALTVGLTDYLQDLVRLSDIFYKTSNEHLLFVPAGRRVGNPARLLRSERMASLLATVRDKLDVVIVDAPAVLPVVDTSVISNQVNGVLVVVASGESPTPAVKHCLERLQHVNSPIIGAVLNKVRYIPREHFYFYSYYGYKSYKDGGKT